MQWLCNILALKSCGKPQAAYMAHVTALLQWLPARVNFTNLECYGGRSARTHARLPEWSVNCSKYPSLAPAVPIATTTASCCLMRSTFRCVGPARI